ncbi:hypothetical protein [Micromonospora sp. CPCC 205739]|uniref:hypothetical protein n=1 Tax=Micromonospora sp. CPCC 205739 TaxID=3122404 RepID=UPI002FF04F36
MPVARAINSRAAADPLGRRPARRQVALDGVDLAHKLAETKLVSEITTLTRGRRRSARRLPRCRVVLASGRYLRDGIGQ